MEGRMGWEGREGGGEGGGGEGEEISIHGLKLVAPPMLPSTTISHDSMRCLSVCHGTAHEDIMHCIDVTTEIEEFAGRSDVRDGLFENWK